jgi:hypothetical protein
VVKKGARAAAVGWLITVAGVAMDRIGPRRVVPIGAGYIALRAFRVVFRNPQSVPCGVIAGLIFIPATILDMARATLPAAARVTP